jgi:hypothetical protein
MTEHRLVATGEYGRQPSALEGERTVPYRVNAAVEHPEVADAHTVVDRTAAESKRRQLSASHDALLSFGQRPNLSFALESRTARVSKRVRLTMHGNVKDTRNRIRPWSGPMSEYDASLERRNDHRAALSTGGRVVGFGALGRDAKLACEHARSP